MDIQGFSELKVKENWGWLSLLSVRCFMFEFIKTISASHGNRKPGWHPSSVCHTVLDVVTLGTGDWTQDLTHAVHVLRHGAIPPLPEKSLPPCHGSLKPCSSSVRSNKDGIASWKKVVTWSVCRVVWDVWGGKNSELRSAEEALLLFLHCLADHVAFS